MLNVVVGLQAAGSTRFAVVALSAHPRLLGINSIGTDTASVFFFLLAFYSQIRYSSCQIIRPHSIRVEYYHYTFIPKKRLEMVVLIGLHLILAYFLLLTEI